ncbi:804_t:CDS:2, partial [Funneliformis geosporum]
LKDDKPEPTPTNKKEEKVLLHANEEIRDFCLFSNWLNTNKKEDIKVFLIIDKKTDEGITYHFNEFNQELEIREMAQLFKKPDPRRRWQGYWIYFYVKEHVPPENKPL